MLKEVLSQLMSLPKTVSRPHVTRIGTLQAVASLSLQMTRLDLRPLPVIFFMGKMALGRIFLLSTSVFSRQHHFTNAPYSTLS
jgi:hypothetical protein